MSARRILSVLLILLGYGALYLALDAQAAFFEASPGVRLWAPLLGLNLALLVLFGLEYVPAVLVASLAGGLLGGDPSLSTPQVVLSSVIVALCTGAAAAWLRRVQPTHPPSALRWAGPLAAVGLVLPAVVAVLTGLGQKLIDASVGAFWAQAALEDSLAGAVGILTLTPLLLVAVGPLVGDWWKETGLGQGLLPRLEAGPVLGFGLELAAIALALVLAFVVPAAYGASSYLCLFPLLFLAWRHGPARATLGVLLLTLGVLVLARGPYATAGDLQLFMIALALTGLLFGAAAWDVRRQHAALKQTYDTLETYVEERTLALLEARHELEVHTDTRARMESSLQASVDALEASRDELAATTAEQARLNARLMASEQQLKDLNARKDKFFSIVSHDVRNMLVSAIGFSKLLLSDAATLPREMIKEFAEHVHQSTTNTYDLLENLLTWTRMQTGRMYYQRAWHSVNELIRNNIAMLQANAAQKAIVLHQDFNGDAQVYADRNMINSVLQNLISNAIKFTERGGEITVASCSYNQTVEVSVTDTGVGIKPEDLDKLFRIDVHHSREGTEHEEGTGLGLVLCKEMIEKHEGKIWVESDLGQGSSFRFTLPCAAEAEAETEVEARQAVEE